MLILAACLGVYFLVQPSPFATTVADARFQYSHAAIPTEIVEHTPLKTCQIGLGPTVKGCVGTGGEAPFAPEKNTWLAVLTSMFLHASVTHVLGNMLYLWVFGNNIEDRLGRLGYLLFYVAGGIAATLAYVASDSASTVPVVGASGAVAAVMGAYFVWFPRAKVSTLVVIMVLRIRAFWLLLFWFGLQFFTSESSHVAWIAHVAGFVFGAVVALLIGRRPAQPAVNS